MQFSNTTSKDGLIQDCEFWTNLGDGTISGDATLLKRFTALMNVRYAARLAWLQNLSGVDGAEDRNYANQQFSTFDILSGTSSYEFLTDGAGNTIADFTGVHVRMSGQTDFTPLDRVLLSDSDAQLVMSPNASNTGTPLRFLEKGSLVFFDTIPDTTGTGKLFYRLVPSYFASTDTTKTPGFVEGGHRLLSLDASLNWLSVNKAENTMLIESVRDEINKTEAIVETYARQKHPTKAVITPARHSSR